MNYKLYEPKSNPSFSFITLSLGVEGIARFFIYSAHSGMQDPFSTVYILGCMPLSTVYIMRVLRGLQDSLS